MKDETVSFDLPNRFLMLKKKDIHGERKRKEGV
jgi:hypothetical protein